MAIVTGFPLRFISKFNPLKRTAWFHIVPKYHLLCHLGEQLSSGGLAPRETWVYLDESKNAYLSQLAQLCNAGKRLDAGKFAAKVMERWVWGSLL